MCFFCFFFQAEDGIRDLYVTGVQTCALPISSGYSSLIGVAAVSANDIWAVGGGQRTVIEHWDGTAWTIVPGAEDPNLETRLAAVTALASDDVWAVGQYFDDLDNGHTLIQHWDGHQCSIVPS